MAQSSTVYTVSVDLSHVDRGVRIPRSAPGPASVRDGRVTGDAAARLLSRVRGRHRVRRRRLDGRRAGRARARSHRADHQVDRGGHALGRRVHRGHKLAGRAAVYTHRDLRQVLAQLEGQGVHRAADVPVFGLERAVIETLAASLDRRTALTLNVMDGQLYVESPAGSLTLPLTASHFA
ncbi:MAG: YaeQ family protein [Vicinamibacterales bacterium]